MVSAALRILRWIYVVKAVLVTSALDSDSDGDLKSELDIDFDSK